MGGGRRIMFTKHQTAVSEVASTDEKTKTKSVDNHGQSWKNRGKMWKIGINRRHCHRRGINYVLTCTMCSCWSKYPEHFIVK